MYLLQFYHFFILLVFIWKKKENSFSDMINVFYLTSKDNLFLDFFFGKYIIINIYISYFH